jgi:hypothetical protein
MSYKRHEDLLVINFVPLIRVTCNIADVTSTQLNITCWTLNLAEGPQTFEEDETEEELDVPSGKI